MSSLFNSLSEELFQILKGSGKTLTLYGEDGNKTYEPKNARRVFAVPGNMMISVIEAGSDSEVKLYLSQSTDVDEVSGLINTLRQVSTRFNVLFNVRKYARELQPKDFAYQASMMEASMYGSTKTSYQKFGPTKLIVRHCAPVREGVFGARGRNILSMFVETAEGERFRFPANHLSGGRAFAQHINQGGKPHDVVGTQITELALEALQLAQTARFIHHNRNLLGEEACAVRPVIKSRVFEIRRSFGSLSRPRGYHSVTESGLPVRSNNLMESQELGSEIQRLGELLQIDSNHALAESLMPVALLTLGEQMTNKNNLFQGVIALDEDAAAALVEALSSEYGHADSSWLNLGSNVAFYEANVFEDACSALALMETGYLLSESDPIADYASAWTSHRIRNSGATDAAGNLIRTADDSNSKGPSPADELADGLRAILGGHMDMPDLPDTGMPQFRDENAKIRYCLDMFVAQHKLANVPTLNYVSALIDKMAEGKKLDGAEKTIAHKLYSAIQADMGMDESIFDESYYSDNPHDQDNSQYEAHLQTLVDQFDVADFVKDIYPTVMNGDDKGEALDTNYVMSNLDAHFAHWMDYEGFQGVKGNFKHEAELVFPQVKEFCEQHGYHFDDIVEEFAQFEDKPEHHGIAAGDNVSTDLGAAQVISVEGDLAVVEFLNGQTKTIHIDDMDKVPGFSNVAEEVELDEWFNSFDPKAVLEREVPEMDEAREPMYHSVFSQSDDGSWGHHFDADDAVDAKDEERFIKSNGGKAVTIRTPKSQANWGMNPDQTNPDEYVKNYLGAKAAKKAPAAPVAPVEEAINKSPTATAHITWNGEDDVEVEVEYSIDDGTFHTGLDYPQYHSYGETVDIDSVVIKATGQDITDEIDQRTLADIQEACIEDAEERRDYELGQKADYDRESRYDESVNEDEEVIGGDKGEDLIDDTKVDEAFQAELNDLLKNARFRRGF